MVKHCRQNLHFLMRLSPSSLLMCCPTLLSDFRQSNGPKSPPGNGRMGEGRPFCITDYRSVVPYMVGQTNKKLVSRFTRMHQAAQAEPHLLCYKTTERTRGLASKLCYEVLVYTSLRYSCRKIYNLYVILEFPFRMEDITKEWFISNRNDTEDMLSEAGLPYPFLSSHLFRSISQMLILNGLLISPKCPRYDPFNGRLNGKFTSELGMICRRHFQQQDPYGDLLRSRVHKVLLL